MTFFPEKTFIFACPEKGDVAQLARALAWHARGRGFEPHLLHKKRLVINYKAFFNYVTGSIPTEYPLKTI